MGQQHSLVLFSILQNHILLVFCYPYNLLTQPKSDCPAIRISPFDLGSLLDQIDLLGSQNVGKKTKRIALKSPIFFTIFVVLPSEKYADICKRLFNFYCSSFHSSNKQKQSQHIG